RDVGRKLQAAVGVLPGEDHVTLEAVREDVAGVDPCVASIVTDVQGALDDGVPVMTVDGQSGRDEIQPLAGISAERQLRQAESDDRLSAIFVVMCGLADRR